MISLNVDFNIPYKDQDISLISKIIGKVNNISLINISKF